MPQNPTAYVLAADDAVRDSICTLLECGGIAARGYSRGADFLRDASLDRNSCLVVDLDISSITGLDFLDQLQRRGITAPAIAITGSIITEKMQSTMDRGGAVLLQKPFPPGELTNHIRRALRD
jgi:FixJ family two-component response regulator